MARRLSCALVCLSLLLFQPACDKSRPTAPSTNPPPPAGNPPSPTTSLEVSGPNRIEPGTTVQWKAIAQKQDGSREDVTGRASWKSYDPGVASVAADGRVTARALGQVTIEATFAGRWTAQDARVLPRNTFELSGTVSQSSFGVPDVTVRVESASIGTGLSVKTDDEGRFALYGVAGSVDLRITKRDYRPVVKTVNVSVDQSIQLQIEAADDLPRVSGSYVVTFSIAGCLSFPQELRTRTYRASVTTKNDVMTVRLKGAKFVGTSNHFEIGMLANQFAFRISGYDDYYYGPFVAVLEQVTSTQTIGVFGTGYGTGTAERISATLDGGFWLNPLDPGEGTLCPGQVTVTMERQ